MSEMNLSIGRGSSSDLRRAPPNTSRPTECPRIQSPAKARPRAGTAENPPKKTAVRDRPTSKSGGNDVVQQLLNVVLVQTLHEARQESEATVIESRVFRNQS
jgi:hypothetical protein